MKAYPERPYGETEQGFYDRLAGLTLADLSFDDFLRWAAYEYLAGGDRRDKLIAGGLGTEAERVAYYHTMHGDKR